MREAGNGATEEKGKRGAARGARVLRREPWVLDGILELGFEVSSDLKKKKKRGSVADLKNYKN